MAICERCGAEFDLRTAKRRIGLLYGTGTYDRYYDDESVCFSCADLEISADAGVGDEISEDMGSGWDD